MMLTTSETTTTWMLAMLSYTTVSCGDMTATVITMLAFVLNNTSNWPNIETFNSLGKVVAARKSLPGSSNDLKRRFLVNRFPSRAVGSHCFAFA
jgi:hypothetical protein